jgi:hypothetical protein
MRFTPDEEIRWDKSKATAPAKRASEAAKTAWRAILPSHHLYGIHKDLERDL